MAISLGSYRFFGSSCLEGFFEKECGDGGDGAAFFGSDLLYEPLNFRLDSAGDRLFFGLRHNVYIVAQRRKSVKNYFGPVLKRKSPAQAEVGSAYTGREGILRRPGQALLAWLVGPLPLAGVLAVTAWASAEALA